MRRRRACVAPWLAGVLSLALTACGGGGSGPVPPAPAQVREHDSRHDVAVVESTLPALQDAPAESDRWVGQLGGAAYRVEVPKNWNGSLLVWARGYWDGPTLFLEDPMLRRHLLERGVAWAASSYTRNMYDVQAAIEDSNQLATRFQAIAAAHGRTLAAPRRVFIAGMSMGGHVAAAAVEAEVVEHAVHPLRYDGALALCGTVTDLGWYQYLAAYQMALQHVLGAPAEGYPSAVYSRQQPALRQRVMDGLADAAAPDEQVTRLRALARQLSGGERPFFAEGWRNPAHHELLFKLMNFAPTIDGILARNVIDTRSVAYRFEEPGQTDPEADVLNAAIRRITPQADPNPLPPVGLRWVPLVEGRLTAPVISMHTLGDVLAPLELQRRYMQRAQAAGQAALLSVRLVRDTGHCAFTAAEVAAAFDALTQWVETGRPPAGDEVSSAEAWRRDDVGCRYTDNRTGLEDRADASYRQRVQSRYPPCAGIVSGGQAGQVGRADGSDR